LTAATTSHTTIQLGWVDTSAEESGFDLERSSDDGINFTQIASLPANTTSYLDDNLLADTLYSYRANAWNSAGNSGAQQFTLPSSLSGPVYVRVKDNQRVAGDTSSHSAQIDHLLIRSDNGSGTVPPPNPPPAQAIDLSASGYKVKGRQAVSLTWSGTEVAQIGIYRDGAPLVGPVPNTGSYTDNINSKGGGSYVYEVCEAGTSTCSNVASVIF
jgi:hypothetical protein